MKDHSTRRYAGCLKRGNSMQKTMALMTIGTWLVAGVAAATDGREEVSSSAGTAKSREFNVMSRFEAKGNETLSGIYARLSNCVGPVDAPTVVGLRVNGALRQECVTIPVYGTPLNEYSRQNGRIFPPLDVAQEFRGGFAVEVSPQGSRLVWYPLEGTAIGLTPYGDPKWTAGTTCKLALRRDNNTISGTVDGIRLGPVAITDPTQKQLLDEPQRFKFYGWQGGLYTIQNAILQDGQP